MPDYTPLSFVGNDTDPKTRIALSMIQQGMDTSPIRSWTQGASRVASSLLGAMMLKDQQQTQKDAMSGIVNSLLTPSGSALTADETPQPSTPSTPSIPSEALSGSPVASTAAPLSGGTANGPSPYGSAIASIESGSNYGAVGPQTNTGDRAYGKYQVMGANIPQWTQEVLGKQMSPQEFLANPQAQDAVFNAKFGQYAKKYGPEGAAKAWFAGPNGMNNPNASDSLGTTVSGYAQKFMNAQPTTSAMAFNGQIASANPLASFSPQPILQPQSGGFQPPPAGPSPSVTNVPVQQAQLAPQGQSQSQGKPILAAPQRANPVVPDNVRQAIITAVNSPDPNARAMGMAMLQKYTQPQSYGFQTAGDGTIVRTNPQTGAIEPVYQTNKPQFTTIGTDQFGNPIHGFVDVATGKVTPAGVTQGQQIGANGLPPQGGVPGQDLPTGQAFLDTQPKPVADQVKALAEGRMQFPAGFALKSPYWQHMIQMVSQYDPSFDAINYNARAKTRNDFTSGKSAQQINAMNTVIGHLQSLSDAGDKLNNSSFTPANLFINNAETLMGDPRYTQFDTTKKAVVDELTRVWRGSGGSEGDIKTWSEQINNANSPEQLHGVIHQIGDLLESKMNAMGEQYKQGMGTSKTPIQLITPQSAKVLDTLRQRAGVAPTQAVPQTSAPVTRTIGGKTYIQQNGQWFQQ